MNSNKSLIETLLTSTARTEVAELLADDVEWIEWGDGVPASGVHSHGRAACLANFGDDEVRTQISRMTEEDNVVVVEGSAYIRKKDGRTFRVHFCHIFEVEDGKVKRKNSFGAVINDPG